MSGKVAPSVREPGDVFQREARQIISTINACPLIQGTYMTVELTTTTKSFDHPLGRPFQGWLVVGKTANGDVWQDTTADANPTRRIALKSDVTMTATIWIF